MQNNVVYEWIFQTTLTIIVILAGALNAIGNSHMMKKYELQVESVLIPTDHESIERNRKRVAALCADCHGADYARQPLVHDPGIGFIPAPNPTSGQGGAVSGFTDQDWIQVLRHGIDHQEGRTLIAMPSMNYFYLNDMDLGEIIA